MWRATDEMLDRQVAVKEMRIDGLDPEDTRTRRERTLREARATARIDHPNVVRIYDVVDQGERLWIVMELVAGRSLEQLVVEDGPLDPPTAARIGLELVAALRQVHAGEYCTGTSSRATSWSSGAATVSSSPTSASPRCRTRRR